MISTWRLVCALKMEEVRFSETQDNNLHIVVTDKIEI